MDATISVQVMKLPHGREAGLPKYETSGAAGMDLLAAIESPIAIGPGERALVPTGIAIAVPQGYEAQVRPRSGLAISHGVTCLNSPGTVDSDYRGEIKVILVNLGADTFIIEPGMRVAQMVFAPVTRVSWVLVEELPPTQRGAGGFGHTGT